MFQPKSFQTSGRAVRRALPLVAAGCCFILAPLPSALLAVAPTAATEAPRADLLGRISFPNSGKAAAQQAFLEGVLYLHNFEYPQALAAFQQAQEADPGFALAYWGEAMTYNHPIWMQQDLEAAQAALVHLAPDAAARQNKAPTEREKAYLQAIETLYGNTTQSAGKSKKERDFLYRDAMRRITERWTEDDEARAFYALSILGTAHNGREFPIYMKAAAAVMPVWDHNRQHPGAAHYLIHSFDDPVHAPLGLPMARAYSEIAPAAAHAQHMTSHIFVALGMWDDVVRANERASQVATDELARQGKPPRPCSHYPFWLEYGYLQQGRNTDASNILGACYEDAKNSEKEDTLWHFAHMRGRVVLDSGDFSVLERYPRDWKSNEPGAPEALFVDLWAALHRNQPEVAKTKLALIEEAVDLEEDDNDRRGAEVVRFQARGLIELHSGRQEDGLSTLRHAAELEAALPYMFGPPSIIKPSAELLGEALTQAGEWAEAKNAFATQLDRTPLRVPTMRKLKVALQKLGDEPGAAEIDARIAAIQRGNEAPTPAAAHHH